MKPNFLKVRHGVRELVNEGFVTTNTMQGDESLVHAITTLNIISSITNRLELHLEVYVYRVQYTLPTHVELVVWI